MYMSKIGLFSLLLTKPTVTAAQASSNDFFFPDRKAALLPIHLSRGSLFTSLTILK